MCADKQRQDIEDALLGSEEESQALGRKKLEKKERKELPRGDDES